MWGLLLLATTTITEGYITLPTKRTGFFEAKDCLQFFVRKMVLPKMYEVFRD